MRPDVVKRVNRAGLTEMHIVWYVFTECRITFDFASLFSVGWFKSPECGGNGLELSMMNVRCFSK